MKQTDLKPAEGKLGILCVGLGAVSSTFITGVLMIRKGLGKPVGSITQMAKIRVGKGDQAQLQDRSRDSVNAFAQRLGAGRVGHFA